METDGRPIGGRYRLLGVLGAGGMATVHRAWDELLHREVALKRLRPGFAADDDFVHRFRPASEIYSLGVVVYEALTGRRPFDGPTPAAVALERLHVRPAPPRAIAPDLSVVVDAIVMRALELDPADRYPSALDFAAVLEDWRARAVGGVRRAGAAARGGPGIRGRRTDPEAPAEHPASDDDPAPDGADRSAAVAAASVAGPPVGPRDPSPAAAEPPPPARRPTSFVGAAPPARERPSSDAPERGKGRRALTVLLPLVALLVAGIAVVLLVDDGERGGVLGTIGSPSASVPSASMPSASVPTTSPDATEPRPTTASAPPPVSPTPTAPATPAPTPEPTRPPQPTAPPRSVTPPPDVAAARGPAETVARFYRLVVRGRFDDAAALWTRRMRERYPTDGNIDGRFRPTTAIDLVRNEVVAYDPDEGTATVAVDLIEFRSSGPSPRRFTGAWDLVLTRNGWRMADPDF